MRVSREIAEVERLGRLGALHRADGRPGDAEPLLREALALAQREYGDDDVRLANRLNELGVLYKDLARYDDAREVYERALAVLERAAGSHEGEVATLYHNLGGIEHARGDYVTAEYFARRGLDLRKECNAAAHELAADMVALAAILDGREEYDEAEELYADALRALECDPDAHALDIAVALNDLGASYARRGRLMLAAETLDRALALKRRIMRADHPDIAVTLNNLGWVEERRGDRAAAASHFTEAVEILAAALGPDHPKTVACRRNAEHARLAARSWGRGARGDGTRGDGG